MSLPTNIQTTIDQILEKTTPSVLRKAREVLTERYRQTHNSALIFSDEAGRLAYLATRFPATFAAVRSVITELLRQNPAFLCQKILDLGAGPATASLAAIDLLPQINEIVLVERNLDAVKLGRQLLSNIFTHKTEWLCQDLLKIEKFPEADLAILSYSLGEIKHFEPLLEKLYKEKIAMLAIIEPGTPFGYQNILRARQSLLRLGAHIIAPCPHTKPCPLKQNDWCHFSTRLERTKLHRLLKEGSLGYEDEKFSYLIVSFTPITTKPAARILRHPQKGSGHVRLSLCTLDGTVEEKTISRKDKEAYRAAKDSEWGDPWL